jgi:hypothetical protein
MRLTRQTGEILNYLWQIFRSGGGIASRIVAGDAQLARLRWPPLPFRDA